MAPLRSVYVRHLRTVFEGAVKRLFDTCQSQQFEAQQLGAQRAHGKGCLHAPVKQAGIVTCSRGMKRSDAFSGQVAANLPKSLVRNLLAVDRLGRRSPVITLIMVFIIVHRN